MRQETKIYFVKNGDRVFNYETGNEEIIGQTRTVAYALVSDTSTERQMVLYGATKRGALTIRLNQRYLNDFDYIEIDGNRYEVQSERKLRHKQTFEVYRVD